MCHLLMILMSIVKNKGMKTNLTGMVDSVNSKFGDIATQVGQTPQGWNSGIFSMIQNLSNNVALPIAGVILALVMTILMTKNPNEK